TGPDVGKPSHLRNPIGVCTNESGGPYEPSEITAPISTARCRSRLEMIWVLYSTYADTAPASVWGYPTETPLTVRAPRTSRSGTGDGSTLASALGTTLDVAVACGVTGDCSTATG